MREGGIKIQNVAPDQDTASARTGLLTSVIDEFNTKTRNYFGLTKDEKEPLNLIQISMNEVSILWELEGNKEVSFLRHQHPLACLENFVPTGFTLFKY